MNRKSFARPLFCLRILICGIWGSLLAIGLTVRSAAGPESLEGTVMAGYQGWFAAEGDGTGMGWHHYGFGRPGQAHIDLWPDLSEAGQEEKHPTPLQMPDGSQAQVFSSAHPATVSRHFQWMKEFEIDGVFLQRFGVSLRNPKSRSFTNTVLANVRRASSTHGRTWAVMYDLSGMRKGEPLRALHEDWKNLCDQEKITADAFYQKEKGKPLVAVWGIGFNDDRDYTLEDCRELLQFLKTHGSGATVMAGVPFGWRTLSRDAMDDPRLLQVLEDQADIISPWSVGRYGNPVDAQRQITEIHAGDADWCRARGKQYLPVIFPGFSWANLMKSRGKPTALNSIPRLQGQLYWEQAMARIRSGSKMLYVAMFDEMDEGTAIFKCTRDRPVSPMQFSDYEGFAPDHYLWLTQQIREVLQGKREPHQKVPLRASP